MGCLHHWASPRLKVQRTKTPFFIRICSRVESLFYDFFHLSNPNSAKQRNESFPPVTGSKPTKAKTCLIFHSLFLIILMQLLHWAVNKDTDMGCRDYRIKLFNNIYKDLSFFRCWVPTGSQHSLSQEGAGQTQQ